MSINYFKFKHFNLSQIKKASYKLSFIKLGDIEKIRIWRNIQIRYLRQKKKLTVKDQKKYFFKIIKLQMNKKKPKLILFVLKKMNVTIGYGGYTNINWLNGETELSFLLDYKRAKKKKLYNYEFNIYLNLIKKLAKRIGFKQILSFTFISRKNHITILENFGFIKEKKMIDKSKKKKCFKHTLKL